MIDLGDHAGLETALVDLGRALDVPPTPDIASAVRVRLAGSMPARRRWAWPGWWTSPRSPALRVALLALAALLAIVGVAAAMRFGLPGLQIIITDTTPPPATAPASPTAPFPADLGSPTTFDTAREAVTFRVFVPDPAVVGEEAAVYLDPAPIGGSVVLAYPTRGLIITESLGRVEKSVLSKVLARDTLIEPVDVDGDPGFWIGGRPHQLLILDPSGEPVHLVTRDIGDVLVWAREGTLLRIESPLGLEATLAIAASMR